MGAEDAAATPPRNFALLGAAGFVAPRHLKAIHDTGNRLVAAADPHDSVGILDRYFPEARFFTEVERFDRHLEKLRRMGDEERVHWVSVCTPNYLHDAHVRLGLRLRANVICEKPLVISPWNLGQLAELEAEYGGKVRTVLQLRYLPALQALRDDFAGRAGQADVVLSYVTRRGAWYQTSWKGAPDKSGGLAMNLGVHFFDLLTWIFGPAAASEVHLSQPGRMAGVLGLERARVRWFLSVHADDLPADVRAQGQHAWRCMSVDGQEIEFSSGFTDLHTEVYRDALAGGGMGIEEARPSVELVHRVRHAEVVTPNSEPHPRVKAGA